MMFRPSLLAAFALSLVAAPVISHRGNDALSVVAIAADGQITVSHRFEAHDLEPALGDIAPDAQPSLDDPDAIAALKLYVARKFRMAVKNKPIMLTVGNVDVRGGEVRVEMTGKLKIPLGIVQIGSTLLTDIYPRQINQVNVRYRGVTRTLRFSGSNMQTLKLD